MTWLMYQIVPLISSSMMAKPPWFSRKTARRPISLTVPPYRPCMVEVIRKWTWGASFCFVKMIHWRSKWYIDSQNDTLKVKTIHWQSKWYIGGQNDTFKMLHWHSLNVSFWPPMYHFVCQCIILTFNVSFWPSCIILTPNVSFWLSMYHPF